MVTARNHAFVCNSETFTWIFSSSTEIVLRDVRSRIRAKFYQAPSWFTSGAILAMGKVRKETGTGDDKERQQQEEWEHVVVLTIFAFLRRARAWRYKTRWTGVSLEAENGVKEELINLIN